MNLSVPFVLTSEKYLKRAIYIFKISFISA